jgi:hypothetical protein
LSDAKEVDQFFEPEDGKRPKDLTFTVDEILYFDSIPILYILKYCHIQRSGALYKELNSDWKLDLLGLQSQ